ncbi:MAG: hypothetical protein ABI831_12985 [Betaproteobacteria bacterium]
MTMPKPPPKKPAPKLHATRTPPIEGAHAVPRDERLIDEAVDESFPASDPPAVGAPETTQILKKKAEERYRAQEGNNAPAGRQKTPR